MTEKELRYLNRTELLELILRQREEIEKLQAKLADAASRLDARYIRLDLQNPDTWEDTARALVTVLKKGASLDDVPSDES